MLPLSFFSILHIHLSPFYPLLLFLSPLALFHHHSPSLRSLFPSMNIKRYEYSCSQDSSSGKVHHMSQIIRLSVRPVGVFGRSNVWPMKSNWNVKRLINEQMSRSLVCVWVRTLLLSAARNETEDKLRTFHPIAKSKGGGGAGRKPRNIWINYSCQPGTKPRFISNRQNAVGKYIKKTRLPSNLRPTTRECTHLVTRGHFRSREKDGGHTIQSVENPMPHSHTPWLCFLWNRCYCR